MQTLQWAPRHDSAHVALVIAGIAIALGGASLFGIVAHTKTPFLQRFGTSPPDNVPPPDNWASRKLDTRQARRVIPEPIPADPPPDPMPDSPPKAEAVIAAAPPAEEVPPQNADEPIAIASLTRGESVVLLPKPSESLQRKMEEMRPIETAPPEPKVAERAAAPRSVVIRVADVKGLGMKGGRPAASEVKVVDASSVEKKVVKAKPPEPARKEIVPTVAKAPDTRLLKPAAMKAAEVKRVEPKRVEVKRPEPKRVDVRLIETRKAADAKAAEAKRLAEAKAEQVRLAQAKASQAKLAEAKAAQAKLAEAKAAQLKLAEAKASQAKLAEAKAAQVKLAEARRAADVKVAQARLADTKREAEMQAAEAKLAEAKHAAQMKAAEARLVETQRSIEATLAEARLAEAKLAETKRSVEVTLAEAKPSARPALDTRSYESTLVRPMTPKYSSCESCGTVISVASPYLDRRQSGWEVRVNFGGTNRVFVYPTDPGFASGERVRLASGRLMRM